MEWFWKVLGIDATTNVAEIKKAFVNETRRLKTLETKEDVSSARYEELAEAEKAAIAFIEAQRNQGVSSYQPRSSEQVLPVKSTSEQEAELKSEKMRAETEIAEAVETEEVVAEPKKALIESVEKAEMNPIESQKELVNVLETVRQSRQAEADTLAKLQKIDETEAELGTNKPVNANSTHTVSHISEKEAVPSHVLGELRELLNDWPRKILLKEWENGFRNRRQWSTAEFVEIRDNFLPLLKEQLAYLPKAVLLYLYEELDLATYELTSSFSWFVAMDELPDFSFDQAVYLPEAEAADYFDRRLHLYHILEQDDLDKRQEIEGLFDYFYREEGWQADYQIADQDVENLGAIYQTKLGIENLVHNNQPNREIAAHLLPPETDLKQVTNQTAKFIRIIFTSLKRQTISLEDSLFIENPQTNYLDDNLRELLVGLVFYRSNDRIKATKHFNNLTNDYQGLVMGLKEPTRLQRQAAMTKSLPPHEPAKKMDLRKIFRFVVIGVIALSFFNSVFRNDDDIFYDDTEYVEDDESAEEWLDPEDPGYAFLTYFIEPTGYRDDIESKREAYIDEWVSPELVDLFEEHLYDSDSAVTSDYEIIYKQLNEHIEHYLITRDGKAFLIVELTDWDMVTGVAGEGWQEVDETVFNELVESIKYTEKDVVENLVMGYFQWPSDEREEYLYEVMDLVNDDMYERLETDLEIVEDVDFEKGSYQMSRTQEDQPTILVRDSDDDICLILVLNEYGQVMKIVELATDNYPELDLKHLEEQAQPKQSLPNPDAVSL